MRRPSDRIVAAALFTAFFALYAFTAQRGFGWGDSGEFQHWILDGKDISSSAGFSNLHPLYLVVARAFASSPFGVTLVSSFFGALAVAGFFFLSRNLAVAVLFGLSHAVWWLSCVAEVYTMSLAFIVFETYFLLKWRETGRLAPLVALAALNGLHLELHNLALLSLPVYAFAFFARARSEGWKTSCLKGLAAFAAWAVAASYWLAALFMRGPADVLVGNYGGEVAGLLPARWPVAFFNWALAAMSFAPAAMVLFLSRRARKDVLLVSLFAVHFAFWARYFIISQFTFVLPSLFFAYLAASAAKIRLSRAFAVAAIELALPVAAYLALSRVGFPSWYWSHPHRDDAAYFALPWKHNDDSADRCASEQSGPWDGYWHPERANGVKVK